MTDQLSVSVGTTLTSTASCLASVLLNSDGWYHDSLKCRQYDEQMTDFCQSGAQLVSEDGTCDINLLDSREVATTLARLEDSSADDSDWSEDRASSDDSEHNYQTMQSVPFNYISDINDGHDQYMIGQELSDTTTAASTTCMSGPVSGHSYRSNSWSDSEDSYEVEEIDASKVPVHIRTLNLSTEEEDSEDSSLNENHVPYKSNISRTTIHRKSDQVKCKNSRNRRGRPPTYCKTGYREKHELSNLKQGRNRVPKDILLWKFILDELRKPDCTHIQWENERLGTFKFVDTVECSRRWGQMKSTNSNSMTFEKLSRSIRYYYKDGLMKRNGLRLVYKINWDKVPEEYCPR